VNLWNRMIQLRAHFQGIDHLGRSSKNTENLSLVDSELEAVIIYNITQGAHAVMIHDEHYTIDFVTNST